MYDDSWDPPFPPDYWDQPRHQTRRPGRLAHLVYLDGKLVDCWTEDPRGTEWDTLVSDRDHERADLIRRLTPPAPVVPTHATTLAWLDAVAGGRSALLCLDAAPLSPVGMPASERVPAGDADRLQHLWRRLAPVDDLFGEEALQAARALVVELWSADRSALTMPTVDRVLAGIVWVIARANDLFKRAGVTHAIVREAVGIDAPLTAHGQSLHRALGGLPAAVGSPWRQEELLPVGRPRLLTSSTRARLVHLRDQALEAADVAAAS